MHIFKNTGKFRYDITQGSVFLETTIYSPKGIKFPQKTSTPVRK